MLKNPISELALFFDLERVPDAASAKRLFDLPEATTEIEAMESLWKHSSKYDAKTNPRPFLKYMFSRVVSIAFLSRRTIYRDGAKAAPGDSAVRDRHRGFVHHPALSAEIEFQGVTRHLDVPPAHGGRDRTTCSLARIPRSPPGSGSSREGGQRLPAPCPAGGRAAGDPFPPGPAGWGAAAEVEHPAELGFVPDLPVFGMVAVLLPAPGIAGRHLDVTVDWVQIHTSVQAGGITRAETRQLGSIGDAIPLGTR